MKGKTILILTMVVLIWGNLPVFGYFAHNFTCDAFGGSCEACDKSPYVENLVIDGGTHFLNANRDFLNLLAKVEQSANADVPGESILESIECASLEIEHAISLYGELCLLKIEYDQPTLDKLKTFDYQGFRETYDLNQVIFKKVEMFLKAGDIIGVYKSFYDDLSIISRQLNEIRAGFPKIDFLGCYSVNQIFHKSGLFSQYVAMVFKQIR